MGPPRLTDLLAEAVAGTARSQTARAESYCPKQRVASLQNNRSLIAQIALFVKE
jgi:hypothetical protein